MAFTPTTNLNLPLIDTGTESGTWGELVDNGLTSYVDIAIAGGLALTITNLDVTLSKTAGTSSVTNIGSLTAQYAILNISGLKTNNRNLNLPITSKWYIINNAGTSSGGPFTLTVRGVTGPTTGVALVDGEKCIVAWNGSDFVKVSSFGGYTSAANTFGFKNRLMNGALNMTQYGSSSGTISGTTANSAYICDRWILQSTAATVSLPWAFVNGSVVNSGVVVKTIGLTPTSTQAFAIAQRIEAVNVNDLYNNTVTVSAILSGIGAASTVTWTAYYANTADTWQAVGSTTAITTGATSIATGTISISGVFVPYSISFNSGTNARSNGLMIVFSGTANNGDSFYIGRIQLEAGDQATQFDTRPYTTELDLCSRYYGAYGSVVTTSTNTFSFLPRVPMRANPTISALGVPSGTGGVFSFTSYGSAAGFGSVYQSTAHSLNTQAAFSLNAEL